MSEKRNNLSRKKYTRQELGLDIANLIGIITGLITGIQIIFTLSVYAQFYSSLTYYYEGAVTPLLTFTIIAIPLHLIVIYAMVKLKTWGAKLAIIVNGTNAVLALSYQTQGAWLSGDYVISVFLSYIIVFFSLIQLFIRNIVKRNEKEEELSLHSNDGSPWSEFFGKKDD